jgi:hypothetical protein
LIRKDHLIAAVENKNRILLANNFDIQSKAQQVFEHSDTIVQKYKALREINEGLQRRLGQLEEEGVIKEQTNN